jgi:hypothetical protein
MTAAPTDGASARADYLVKQALPHLVRLEAFFRMNELTPLAEGMEEVLLTAEKMLTASSTGDGQGDARSRAVQDQQPCNAESMQERHGRAALG